MSAPIAGFCKTHSEPCALNADKCSRHHEAEPDVDGWWSIDWRECVIVQLVESNDQ